MANTGYKINPVLKKVSDDVNEYPLDDNNHRTTGPNSSGLPQDTMSTPVGDSRYRMLDPDCTEYTFTKTKSFQRTNCVDPQVGTIVPYSEEYTSSISTQDAEDKANADDTGFNVRGMTYANINGVCKAPLPADATGILVLDIYNNRTLDAFLYVDSVGTAPHRQIVHKNGANFLENDGTPAANCWLLASDTNPTGTLALRFEGNIARMENTYPMLTTWDYVLFGRGASAGFIDGLYAKKGANVGKMKMNGSPGSYMPSTESTNNLETITFGGKAIQGGADGNIGFAYGAEIMRFRYNKVDKSLTLL